MCLEKAKAITLKEDKIVYKVVGESINGNLFSPFQWNPIHLSDEVQHDMVHPSTKKSIIKEINGHKVVALTEQYVSSGNYCVFGGVFHSFEHYKDALYLRNKLDEKTLDYEYVVVKCIIPKDAKLVMRGTYEYNFYNFSAFGSSDIIMKEIVKEGE